jgi:hypothetical protein
MDLALQHFFRATAALQVAVCIAILTVSCKDGLYYVMTWFFFYHYVQQVFSTLPIRAMDLHRTMKFCDGALVKYQKYAQTPC